MSQLIDTWIYVNTRVYPSQVQVDGEWYIAKPISYDRQFVPLQNRLRDALRVLTGRSFAVHFKQDEWE